MKYLENIWYVGAWAHDVTAGRMLPRVLFGEPVVFFRGRGDRIAAIRDVCPHRFAPLHMGRLEADSIECGYHGLRFDASGACVHNPHGAGVIPPTCRVRSFPVIERHGVIWIWPGAPAAADETLVPDFSYLIASDLKTVFGMTLIKANYELITDNLMDASHTQYVHKDLLGTSAFAQSRHEVFQDGAAVHSHYLVPGTRIPAAYEAYFSDRSIKVDYSINFRWIPPALIRNSVSLVPVIPSAGREVLRTGSHFMTPETDLTTHYFFAHTRNFERESQEVDGRIRWWQKSGLIDQDGPMIEAVQRMMATTDLNALKPVFLPTDTAAIHVRRALARLIDAENQTNSE